MFRFLFISNLTGSLQFSHYFESVPVQLLNKYEKDIVESCLTTGEKEVLFPPFNFQFCRLILIVSHFQGNIRKSDTFVAFRREGLLLVVVGAVPTANGNIVSDLLHAFVYILVHHMKIMVRR